MLPDLSDSDFDVLASLTVKDASMGVVIVCCVVLMITPFLFIVLALLPERGERDASEEGKVR